MSSNWEGLIGTLNYCEENKEIDENIKILQQKLQTLEEAKTVLDLKQLLCVEKIFTEKEINYLNSPLLDEILSTITNEDAMLECCRKSKCKALNFYMKKEIFENSDYGVLFAVKNNCKEIVSELLKNAMKNDMEINKLIYYAIMYACDNENKDIVEILVTYFGKDIFAEDPLQFAARKGNLEIFKYLVDNGADVNDSFSLQMASEYGHVEIVKFILPFISDKTGNYSLQYACEKGHKEIAELLIDFGYQIILDDNDTNSNCLDIACENNHVEIVKLLLEKGADPNTGGQMTFINAAKRGKLEIVKLFIAHGIDMRRDNDAILCLTSDETTPEILNILLENARISFDEELPNEIDYDNQEINLMVIVSNIVAHSKVENVKVVVNHLVPKKEYNEEVPFCVKIFDTLLDSACRHGKLVILDFLLEYELYLNSY